MNRGILALSAAVLLSAGGIVAVSNTASAQTVTSLCSSSGPDSGSWVINANDDVPAGVVISSVTLDQGGATVTAGIGTRQVQVQYVGDALSGTVTFSDGETDGFSAQGDCTFEPTTPSPTQVVCPDGGPQLLHGSPPVVLTILDGPGTVTVTGQTSDSHPGHATQGQTGEKIGIFAVPTAGGPEIVIIAETDDVPESSDDPPPVPFNASANLGPQSYTIVLRHVGGGPLNSVCVSAEVSFEPPSTTTVPETSTTTTTTLAGTTTTLAGTTTTTLAGTTTTLPEDLDIGSASTVCVADAPFVELTFGNQSAFNGHTGTITFVDLDGNVIETHAVTYQANTTVRLVYPGAAVDPVTGEALDWPGWMLNEDGFWVLDPSDARFRDGLTIVAEINPTATTTISYPPETAACNSPDGPFPPGVTPPPGSPSGQLPTTL